MTEEEFRKLGVGDMVRHPSSEPPHLGYVVTGNYGGRVTVVRTADMTNPAEWEIVRTAYPSEAVPPFGYCPHCRGPAVNRARSADGNDRCVNGHVYPSKAAVKL